MSIKKVFLLFCIICFTHTVSAKDVEKKNNFFIGAGGGVNMYQGADDNAFGIGKRLSPALDVYLGKWFTPYLGGRVSYSGLYAKGWSPVETYMSNNFKTDNYYKEEFSTMYFHADFMWNISNTIGGYRYDRFWNFIPYLGAGYIHFKSRTGYNSSDEIAASVGLYNTMRISRIIDITIDIRQTIFSPRWIDATDESKFNYMATASLGLAFKIGGKRVKKGSDADILSYKEQINYLKQAYNRANEKAEKAEQELEVDRLRMRHVIDSISMVAPVVVYKEPNIAAIVPIALFFEVGKPDIGAKEIVNLNFYVENAIKANPNRIFTITGIADNSLGKKADNKVLAEKRVQYVYDLLINEYNIKPGQLQKKEVVTYDMFPDSRLNRVVIIK